MTRARCESERAVSSALGYILNLSVAAIVLVGLGAAGTVFFEANTDTAVREDLSAYGNELAGEIQAVDRLAAERPGQPVDTRAAIGRQVRGSGYVVEVVNASAAAGASTTLEHADECDRQCLVLVTTDGDVSAVVNFVAATPIESTRFDGGPVVVRRPAGADHIRFERLEG